MENSDQAEFARVLVGMAAMKPGAKLTPEAIDLWWAKMRIDWTIEDFKTAATHLVGAVEWMPSPYHFEQLRIAGEPTAAEAWLAVVGGVALPPGSRAARAALMVGGQQAIRHADTERDLPHKQRRFLEIYAELRDVDHTRRALPHLATDAARTLLVELNSIPKLLR